MGEFTSPWLTWVPGDPRVENDTRQRGTDKTDKSREGATSVSFVSASAGLTDPNDSTGGALPTLADTHAGLTNTEREKRAADAAPGDQLGQLVLDAVACTPDVVAWRLYSRRLDRELWVARDAAAAVGLDAHGARVGLPVVLADDLERLRDFDDQRLRDVLEALAVFPGARLAELDPEAAS
jgi:hypothetical protein